MSENRKTFRLSTHITITHSVGAERNGYRIENRNGAGDPISFYPMFVERPADGEADTALKTDLTAFRACRYVGRAAGLPEWRHAQHPQDI